MRGKTMTKTATANISRFSAVHHVSTCTSPRVHSVYGFIFCGRACAFLIIHSCVHECLQRQTLAASMLDIETDRSNIVRVGQTYRASGGKVEAAGRASSTRAVLVGGQIPPLTGGSELQAQTTGRASMCSQAMTEDRMSGLHLCMCVN